MSYALGMRIKELRTKHGFSQEQMAEVLDTTRQRYSRLENGQIDISFLMIKKLAEFLGVSTHEITNAVEEEKGLTVLFREKSSIDDMVPLVSKVEEILKVFNAHGKLYHQMKERDSIVD